MAVRARRAPARHGGRTATVTRGTAETDIRVTLNLDGRGRYEIETGVPFLNHMLEIFARHGFFDLSVRARGDVEVDDHHTVEDVGSASGRASARRSATRPASGASARRRSRSTRRW